MFVSQEELQRVKEGSQIELWMPVVRGSVGQRPAPPVERHVCIGLQERPFTRGVKVTVTEVLLSTLAMMDEQHARAQGFSFLRDARVAWERSYGAWNDDREAWVIRFLRGNHTAFYARHQERYLRAKMGGGRHYTTDPSKAVGGTAMAWAHAVPYDDELKAARNAAIVRAAAAHKALERALASVEWDLQQLRARSPDGAAGDIARLERRAARIKEQLRPKAA